MALTSSPTSREGGGNLRTGIVDWKSPHAISAFRQAILEKVEKNPPISPSHMPASRMLH